MVISPVETEGYLAISFEIIRKIEYVASKIKSQRPYF